MVGMTLLQLLTHWFPSFREPTFVCHGSSWVNWSRTEDAKLPEPDAGSALILGDILKPDSIRDTQQMVQFSIPKCATCQLQTPKRHSTHHHSLAPGHQHSKVL